MNFSNFFISRPIFATVLAIILTALAGLTYTTARQAVRNTDSTTLQAASVAMVNRFTALPYASLSASGGSEIVQQFLTQASHVFFGMMNVVMKLPYRLARAGTVAEGMRRTLDNLEDRATSPS